MDRKSLQISAIAAAVLLVNGVVLMAEPAGLVSGTVVMDGFPMAGAEVLLDPYFGEDCPVTHGTTDLEGYFEVFPELGCRYRLVVLLENGLEESEYEAFVTVYRPENEIKLVIPTAESRGAVFDQGKAVTGARIWVVRSDWKREPVFSELYATGVTTTLGLSVYGARTTTDDLGTYAIPSLQTFEHNVHVFTPDGRMTVKDYLPDEVKGEYASTIFPGGALRLRLLTDGSVIEKPVLITLGRGVKLEKYRVELGNDGFFAIPDLVQDSYRVTVQAERFAPQILPDVLIEGADTIAEVPLSRGGDLIVRVHDGEVPVEGLRIILSNSDRRSYDTLVSAAGEDGKPILRTDVNGVWRGFHVPEGEYTVCVTAGSRVLDRTPVLVRDGEALEVNIRVKTDF
jgi:hypothetical protein